MSAWDRQPAVTGESQSSAIDQGLRSYMLKVYNYMASGVLLTAIIAYFAGTSPAFQSMLFTVGADGAQGVSPLFWILAFAPAAMGFLVLPRMGSMSLQNAQLTFWVYAALMGLSFCSIFMVYTEASVFRVFLITAGTFGLLSMVGYTTKRDLSSMGTFIFVGVMAVFIVSLLNMFLLKSSGLDLLLSYVGVALALGMTAYHTQKTKSFYYQARGNAEMVQRVTIMGALDLYFAFIYLFINLLRIMGDRR